MMMDISNLRIVKLTCSDEKPPKYNEVQSLYFKG